MTNSESNGFNLSDDWREAVKRWNSPTDATDVPAKLILPPGYDDQPMPDSIEIDAADLLRYAELQEVQTRISYLGFLAAVAANPELHAQLPAFLTDVPLLTENYFDLGKEG